MKLSRCLQIGCFLGGCWPWGVCAQECPLQIRELSVHDQTGLLESTRFAYQLEFPEGCEVTVSPAPILHRECSDPIVFDMDASVRKKVEIQCVYDQTGFFYTPPIQIMATTGQEAAVEIYWPEFREIEVAGKSGDQTEWAVLEWKQYPIWMTFILAAILLIGGGAGLYRWQKRRRSGQKTEVEPLPEIVEKRPPLEVFLAEMLRLREISPESIGEYQQFADAFSLALRNYLGDRFGIDALMCTTSQLLENLVAEGFAEDQCGEVGDLLGQCDRVKFSGWIPGQDALKKWIERAGKIVDGMDSH